MPEGQEAKELTPGQIFMNLVMFNSNGLAQQYSTLVREYYDYMNKFITNYLEETRDYKNPIPKEELSEAFNQEGFRVTRVTEI